MAGAMADTDHGHRQQTRGNLSIPRLHAAPTCRSLSMNELSPKRKYLFLLLAGIASVSLLYQIVKGWDTVEFLVRVVFSTALALVTWRASILAGQACSGAGSRSAAYAACWVLGAAALFVGLMLGV
jgi:hypothetical protein